jgi:hypothetical protein
MDYDVELRFQEVKGELEKEFGGGMDVQTILFLIGVNELGMGHREFSKNEKTDLLHIAICTILEPYGFYEFQGRDDENWPHFELIKGLPSLNHQDQQHLLKEAIIAYFTQNEYVSQAKSSS